MGNYKTISALNVNHIIYDLVDKIITPNTGVNTDDFFTSLSKMVTEFANRNAHLLSVREEFQTKIDAYHVENQPFDVNHYTNFLTEIGYILPDAGDFQVSTAGVDPEIASIAGAQLVAPVSSASVALNAANARWGSLYNALYGTPTNTNIIDTADDRDFTDGFNPTRGRAVAQKAGELLDEIVPLEDVSHNDVQEYLREGEVLKAKTNSATVGLKEPAQFVGYAEDDSALSLVLLKHNDLHIEICINSNNIVGANHEAGVCDVMIESAVTTILDMEDSVAAVDAEDKAEVYANFNGLMRGDLSVEMNKPNQKPYTRKLADDREYTAPNGEKFSLSGRSMMLIRNVGMYMYTDAVTTLDGAKIPESFLDVMITGLAAKHDLAKPAGDARNSKTGKVYIVKPKMHSPDEVALAMELFAYTEKALDLPDKTLLMGIMDEEQRMSVNLKQAVEAAKDRVIFINTGFLDRTGDLIHTNMLAGAFDNKVAMNSASWKDAYERSNVQVALETGLQKFGQIGKGMFAQNRNMKGLLASKHEHPLAGADTAWVPSPTGATIHALHYHLHNVKDIQAQLIAKGNQQINKADILTLPLLKQEPMSAASERALSEPALAASVRINDALLNGYTQSILGYVVRWVNQGVGCSSVPDQDDVYLMEDRATLRIGSQLLANWVRHEVVTWAEVEASFARMAAVVDAQNAEDASYTPLIGNFDAPAYQASLELVSNGLKIENGYVEYSLDKGRLQVKG